MKVNILYTHVVFCILSLLFSSDLQGQLRPSALPEDMDEHSLAVKCYCSPGVRNKTRSKGISLSYQFLTGGNLRSTDGKIGEPFPEYSKFRNLKTKLSLPIIRRPQFKTVISMSYQAEQYELNEITNDYQDILATTDDLNFKSSGFGISYSYSPNATNYIGGKISLRYNGSYGGLIEFSNQYAIYGGAIAYGIKKHEDNEWGFGLAGSKNFRRQGFRVLPFLFWNKTINDHWGYQLTFPSSYKLRYNLDPKTIFVASANYNGESYSFDQFTNDNRAIAFNHSEVLTVLRMEREILPWVWVDAQVGYHFNFNSDFELQSSQETILDIDPDNSILLKIGIFISPSDSFVEGKDRNENPPAVY